MARHRSEAKKDFPLYLNQNGQGYFYYKDKQTGKYKGLGRDKEAAVRYANRMNELMGIGKPQPVAEGYAGFAGTLTAEYILGMAKSVKRTCGIYFLMHEREIVYVGQSVNCHARMGTHLNDDLKVFDSYFIIECPANRLDELEAKYIVQLRPKYNLAIPRLASEITKLYALLERAA
jgi:hypothetical protein